MGLTYTISIVNWNFFIIIIIIIIIIIAFLDLF